MDRKTPVNNAQARPEAPSFQPGQVLSGKYEILSLIGSGGMGSVYRVRQIFLDKEFALKVLDHGRLNDATARRFQVEARTASQLKHPNLVVVHDFGVCNDDQPYLVMDLIEGVTLADHLTKKGSLTVSDAVPLIIQLCFGLIYAHEHGVVHRDIKPANILLTKPNQRASEGIVKIVDFGIAKVMQSEDGEIQALTKTGEIFGSPPYMSPEQCKGLPIDQRSDIYSLGCVLFEILTGSPPFFGDTALATMMMRISQKPPSLKEGSLGAEFPVLLERVAAKMLAIDPAERYQNLSRVVENLMPLLTDPQADASRVSPPATKQKPRVSFKVPHEIPLVLCAVLLTFFASQAYFAWRQSMAKEPQPATAPQMVTVPTKDDPYPRSEIFVDVLGEKHRRFHFGNSYCGLIGPNDNHLVPAKGDITFDSANPVLFKVKKEDDKGAEGSIVYDPAFFCHMTGDEFYAIVFSDNPKIDSKALALIPKFTGLKELRLDHTCVNSLDFVYELPNLQRLSINEIPLNTEQVLKLPQLLKLRRLYFGPVSKPAAVVKALQKSDYLDDLSIFGAGTMQDISDKDIPDILKLPHLERLYLTFCPGLTNDGAKLLLTDKHLTRLRLADCGVDGNITAIVRQSKSLKQFLVSTRGWTKEQIADLKTLSFAKETDSREQKHNEIFSRGRREIDKDDGLEVYMKANE